MGNCKISPVIYNINIYLYYMVVFTLVNSGAANILGFVPAVGGGGGSGGGGGGGSGGGGGGGGSGGAPCFSQETLRKILPNIEPNRNFIVVHEPRNNKKMYRCDIKNFGKVEFTHDHGFLYNNKIYTFEELLNIYPNISNIEEIPNDEITTVYNIIGHTKQISHENLFKINDELLMFGGTFNFEITQEYFEKKLNIINNLKNNEIVANKYFIRI